MNRRLLRKVAAIDAANVVGVAMLSGPHGAAAAVGYAPALVGTMVAHVYPQHRRTALVLCALGLIPNTVGSITALDRTSRSRLLSIYVGVGGALLGIGYIVALRRGVPGSASTVKR